MLKDKGILKFKYNEKKGSIHYITYKGNKVALTKSTAGKIEYIKKTNTLDFLKGASNSITLDVTINEDSNFAKEVYDYMLEQKFTHFKKGHEGLVVLTLSL